MIPYNEMDPEVVTLCKALNALPGVVTTESCCGHGKDTFKIWFQVDATPVSVDHKNACMQGLFFLTRCIDNRYFEFGPDWSISLSVGDTFESKGIYPTQFMLECHSKGREAYGLANNLYKNMIHHLNHPNFKEIFDIDLSLFECKRSDNESYMFNV